MKYFMLRNGTVIRYNNDAKIQYNGVTTTRWKVIDKAQIHIRGNVNRYTSTNEPRYESVTNYIYERDQVISEWTQ